MEFYELLEQVLDLLRQRGRVSYRALKAQFHLDDDYLAALQDDLSAILGSSSGSFDLYRASSHCEASPVRAAQLLHRGT